MTIFLTPWYGVDDARMCALLEEQLVREVGPQHKLYRASAKLVARRQDNDDCLFALDDGRVACVHLTWRQAQETDPRWPAAAIFDSVEAWAEQVMLPDNAEWSE